jgi:DNA-directed RNA polymerase specialized sigma24 family protein
MGSLTDAEDVLQEALLAAWRGLDGCSTCRATAADGSRPSPSRRSMLTVITRLTADQLSRTPTSVLGSSGFPSGTGTKTGPAPD